MPDLYCRGIIGPVRLPDGELASLLSRFMGDWPVEIRRTEGRQPALIEVKSQNDGSYLLKAPWLTSPLTEKNVTRLFCSLAVDLATAYLKANPALTGLHGAAVDFGGRAAIFPSVNRSGKSLLTAGLMAAGQTSFGDDLVALTPENRVLSFGLPPRLRLPLPNLPETLADYIGRHLTLADQHYGFLKTGEPNQAAFEQEQAIGAVILLDRRSSGRAELRPADREAALTVLVNRCLLLNPGQALSALDRARQIVQSASTWQLKYSDLPEALEVLTQALGPASSLGLSGRADWDPARKPAKEEPPQSIETSRFQAASPSFGSAYVRSSQAIARQADTGLFLVDSEAEVIFHLNQVGRLIWDFLAEPLRPDEALDLIRQAFPQTAPEVIRADLEKFFRELENEGLIISV